MTNLEYREACRTLGVTPTIGACKVLGISRTTAARYSSGSHPVPEPIAKLLTALLAISGSGETDIQCVGSG